MARLRTDIDQMNCDFGMLPKVWNAENVRNDAAAERAQTDRCHSQFGN